MMFMTMAVASAQIQQHPLPPDYVYDGKSSGEKHNVPAATSSPSLTGTYLTESLTDGPGLSLNSSTLTWATTEPIQVSCPSSAKKGCYLEIDLRSQFDGLFPADSSNVIAGAVYIDGSTSNVLPANPAGLDSTSTGGASNSRYGFWHSGLLSSGMHMIEIGLYVSESGGSAGSASRTVKVTVVKSNKAE
jgi:hypothetical protein